MFETVTAAMFIGLAWRTGADPQILGYSWLAAVGVPLAATDLAVARLPNVLILPSYPVSIGLFGLVAAIDHAPVLDAAHLAGMAIVAGLYLLLYVAAPGQLGGLLGLTPVWAG